MTLYEVSANGTVFGTYEASDEQYVLLPVRMDESGAAFQNAAGDLVVFTGDVEFSWSERRCGALGTQKVLLASVLNPRPKRMFDAASWKR